MNWSNISVSSPSNFKWNHFCVILRNLNRILKYKTLKCFGLRRSKPRTMFTCVSAHQSDTIQFHLNWKLIDWFKCRWVCLFVTIIWSPCFPFSQGVTDDYNVRQVQSPGGGSSGSNSPSAQSSPASATSGTTGSTGTGQDSPPDFHLHQQQQYRPSHNQQQNQTVL